MKEITDKLAWEIITRLDDLESLCDKMARKGKSKKYDVDPDWMAAGVLCFDIRAHLYHHMENMIEHPEFVKPERAA